MKQQKLDRTLGIFAIATMLIAWIIGANLRDGDIYPFLQDAFPEAGRFEPISGDQFVAIQTQPEKTIIGYVAMATANGYGGPMKLAVAVDLKGKVHGISIVSQKETPSWLKKVSGSRFISSLFGKSYLDPFELGEDVDGVSGATYASRAIAEAALQGSRKIAKDQLGLELPAERDLKIQFGIPEITLIALFAIGYFGLLRRFKYTKQARWAATVIGLVVLGFVYDLPLTLSSINKFLLGFWPEWQTHLYWYLLIGGILFIFTVDNKNPYCQWFCPFGAAQECLGVIGVAKVRSAGKYRNFLKWLQRGLAWFAILVALLFHSPGISSYEIFGTLFSLTGSTLQFALLGIILIASLFIKRPWCHYLCPIHPVDEFIRMARGWIIELWKTLQNKR
ncbi:MAG: 4Fe-4S binding protein [Acidobacteria bacterium]|nr:4Fe-4S binding protein [Acidobacteriota bacterium]